MRLFIAVKPHSLFLKALETISGELKRLLPKVSFVPIQNMHLTLCFIGETDKIELLKTVINGIPFNSFNMEMGRLGTFGRGDSTLIWVGLNSCQALETISAAIRVKLLENGINFDSKPFRPHITVARRALLPAGFSIASVSTPKEIIKCNKIELLKSEKYEGKPFYTPVAAFYSTE
jgi:2'-5' RNA ligase